MATYTDAIQKLYVAYFNRPADFAGLTYWEGVVEAAKGDTSAVSKAFAASDEYKKAYAGMDAYHVLNQVYNNLFGHDADLPGLQFWGPKLQAGSISIDSVVTTVAAGAQGTDLDAYNAKVAAATAFSNQLDTASEILGYSGDVANGMAKTWLSTVKDSTTLTAAIADTALAATVNSITHPPVPGQTYSLTIGADTLVGTSGNDTFSAAQTSGVTLTVGDVVNGGAGTDTLNITQTAAFSGLPVGATVTGVEHVNVVSGGTVDFDTTTGFTGLTDLSVSNAGAATVNAAETINVTATETAVAGADVSVTGGNNVTVTTSGATTGEINVNGAVGAVNVTAGGSFDNSANATQGAVNVVGGTTVNVTETSGAGAATLGATNNTVTQGDVNVDGADATTAVTVTQEAPATAAATTSGNVGVVNGAVTINDANATSATDAGTIATVTLKNYGNSTVNSGALATVNLSGKGGTLGLTEGALTTAAVTSLALNVSGLSAGAITLDSDIKTLNLAGSTASSTIANITGTSVTTLNVSGSSSVTLTADTFAALTSVVSTNTAGVKLGTALGADVAFTGGDGKDTITLSSGFTQAITMGAGDDRVVYGGAASTATGKVGSVDAGAGNDTIVMTGAQAAAVSGSAAFNSSFTGFEALDVATGATETLNLAAIDGVNSVVTRGAAGLTINGYTSGGTLTLDAASTTVTANVTNAVLNAGDVFNVKLSNATAATVAFGTVNVAGVETVNITTIDAGTSTASKAATVDTATLVATSATKIVVSGHDGLNLTNTGNTAVTSFDASGVTADGTSDTSANLGVTFASANTSASAAVSIIGGEGNDTLTGNVGTDTITGGKGSDTMTGGQGADVINAGAGHDVIVINSEAGTGAFSDSSTAAFDVVNGFKTVGTAIAAVDLSTNGNFISTAAGNADLSLLDINLSNGTAVALNVEADGTGTGVAAGVATKVVNGVLTLSGTGASAVDTLAEWLAEAAHVAATAGDVVAFQFGSDTYVFAENGAQDILVELVGVSATALVHTSAATTAPAGAILLG